MRRLSYCVAASLDGYIADAAGAYDWIPHDATVDFAALYARFDTFLLGRRTFDVVRSAGGPPFPRGARVYVVSRTLPPGEQDGVTVVRDDPVALAASLRREAGGREIWLFGGGALFATLLAGGQVDAVEVTVVPVLLGGGVPLLGPDGTRAPLRLTHTHPYPSGMVTLHYDVPGAAR